jgi:hypothetical protein
VSRFVITITPDNADAGASNTTVRVDTSSGQARITELTVRAADGGGLAPADLPAVDLDLLIRALAAPSAVQALTASETAPTDLRSAVAASTTPVEHVESAPAATVEPIAAEERAPTTGRRGRKATTARKSTAKKVAAKKATPRKSAAAKNTTTAKKATKAARRTAADAGAEATAATRVTGRRAASTGRKATGDRTDVRAYRRMPEPDEVMAAYTSAGTITGLAEHFGVPRHTANGWARRLRQQGRTIGRA